MERTFSSIALCILTLPLMAVNTELVRTAVGYKLALNGLEHEVNSYDVDSSIRSLDENKLSRLAQAGCIRARQMSNGDYRVEIGGGLKGGGAIGALIGATGGYAAGKVAGQVVVVFGGYAILFGTQKVIGIYTGPAAEQEFAEKLHSRFLPKLWEVSEKVAEVASIAGAGAGGVASGPA